MSSEIGSRNEEAVKRTLHCKQEHISAEDLNAIEEQGELLVPPEEMKKAIFENASYKLRECASARRTCAVCDCSYTFSQTRLLLHSNEVMKKVMKFLRPSDEVPKSLRKYYNVSNWIPPLKGILLSPKGIEGTSLNEKFNPTGFIFMCHSCFQSLKGKPENPPRFSIANGFDIGGPPANISECSDIERRLCSLASVASNIVVLRGGKHKAIKGHTSVVAMNPNKIATTLPKLLGSETDQFHIIISSSMTPKQKLLAMKRHPCRASVARDLLQFYKENKEVFKRRDVFVDEKAMESVKGGL